MENNPHITMMREKPVSGVMAGRASHKDLELERNISESVNADGIKRLGNGKPKIFFFGMPGADTSYWDMNIAQAPQGPTLKAFGFLPNFIRKKINTGLKYAFNPRKKAPYTGMHLIKQNLEQDVIGGVDITLIDHPTEKEVLRIVKKTRFKVIGIAIGCENKVYEAKALAQKIRKHSKNKDVEIVFGNYGATTGKQQGILTNADGAVLKDNPAERRAKEKSGKHSFTGEGVQSMRAFLLNNQDRLGMELRVEPDAPLVSQAIPDPDFPPDNPILRFLAEKSGLSGAPIDMNKLAVSLGCVNSCSFCNTAKNFGGKTLLFKNAGEMFQAMKKQMAINKARENYVPETLLFLMDENFMRPIDNTEELCHLIEKSGDNIRWGTFGDIKGLLEYKRKHKDFRGLVRGGMMSLWVGLESKADVFKKRGGASIEEVEGIISELQSLGILVFGSFIPGLSIHTEGETKILRDEEKLLQRILGRNGHMDEKQSVRLIEAKKAAKQKFGRYHLLNIWEDISWWLKQNTAANQVMMLTDTRLVNPQTTEPMLTLADEKFGHTFLRDDHPHISGKRLEEIDRTAREMFYRENGPVALRTVLTMWEGFQRLKDSKNDAEILAATYYYWVAKRSFHAVSLSTFFFSETLFEKCSRKFLGRLAHFLDTFEKSEPPDGSLNEKYRQAVEKYHNRVFKVAKFCASRLRRNFIKKYLAEI